MSLPEKRIKLCGYPYSYPINWQSITGYVIQGVPGISWLLHKKDVKLTQLGDGYTQANINSLYSSVINGRCMRQCRYLKYHKLWLPLSNRSFIIWHNRHIESLYFSPTVCVSTVTHKNTSSLHWVSCGVDLWRGSVAGKRRVENPKATPPYSFL